MFARFLSSAREVFTLRNARETAAKVPPARRELTLEYLRAADRRWRFDRSAVDGDSSVLALARSCAALPFLVRAVRAVRGDDPASLDAADELVQMAPADGDSCRLVANALRASDPLYLDRLDEHARGELAAAFAEVGRSLRARIDVRSEAYLRATAWGRIAALALALTLVLHRLLAAPDLALHKTVTQSSTWPGAPPPSVLVDGNTTGAHGPGTPGADYLHTNKETSPWALIDLGQVRTVREVVVYNRNDTNFDDALPIDVELSADGLKFTPVARRTEHFGTSLFDPPWRARFDAQHARYVRLRGHDYLALSEVEVFGR